MDMLGYKTNTVFFHISLLNTDNIGDNYMKYYKEES